MTAACFLVVMLLTSFGATSPVLGSGTGDGGMVATAFAIRGMGAGLEADLGISALAALATSPAGTAFANGLVVTGTEAFGLAAGDG